MDKSIMKDSDLNDKGWDYAHECISSAEGMEAISSTVRTLKSLVGRADNPFDRGIARFLKDYNTKGLEDMFITVRLPSGVTVKLILHSVNDTGGQLVTFKLRYPRLIHSEVMTHCAFSKNSASSRAIPVSKNILAIKEQLASPAEWGKNKAGMQSDGAHNAKVKLFGFIPVKPATAWKLASRVAIFFASAMSKAGFHKQVCNRLLEPFMFMEVILTGSDFDGFFEQRCHEDADPTFRLLALGMKMALDRSIPKHVGKNSYHIPYFKQNGYDDENNPTYAHLDSNGLMLVGQTNIDQERALAMSVARCATISFRNEQYDEGKLMGVYGKLIGNEIVHWSPFEHQATPVSDSNKYHKLTGWKSLRYVQTVERDNPLQSLDN